MTSSNQVFSSTNRIFDNLIKEWSSCSMITPIDASGYDTNDFLINSNYTVEGSWCQIGGNVTKNSVIFSEGPSVNFVVQKSIKGPSFNTDTGEFNIFFDGTYRIQGTATIKRTGVVVGDRCHFLGISLNGADPTTCTSGYGVSDRIFNTVNVDCTLQNLVKNDKISLNYAQTEGSDEIFCAINFYIENKII